MSQIRKPLSSTQIFLFCLCVGLAGISASIIPAYQLEKQNQHNAEQALTQLNQRVALRLSAYFKQLDQLLTLSSGLLAQSPRPLSSRLEYVTNSLPSFAEPKLLSIDNIDAAKNSALKLAAESAITTASTVDYTQNGTASVQLYHMIKPSNFPVLDMPTDQQKEALALTVDISAVLEPLINELPFEGFEFSIYDLKQQAKQPFYQQVSSKKPSQLKFNTRSSFQVADREWLIESTMTPRFFSNYRSPLASWIWLPGCILTLLLVIRIWQSQHIQNAQNNKLVKTTDLLDRNQRVLENKKIEKEVLTQALIDSEKRTRDFLLLSNDYFWELDTEFRFVFASPQTANVKGIAPQDLLGRSLFDFLEDENITNIQQQMKTTIKGHSALSLSLNSIDSDKAAYKEIVKLLPLVDSLGIHLGYRGTGQRLNNTI